MLARTAPSPVPPGRFDVPTDRLIDGANAYEDARERPRHAGHHEDQPPQGEDAAIAHAVVVAVEAPARALEPTQAAAAALGALRHAQPPACLRREEVAQDKHGVEAIANGV